MKHFILALAALLCASVAPAGEVKAAFSALVDAFFDEAWFRFHPADATSAGFHGYDARLEDFSRASIDAEIAALKRYLQRFEKLGAGGEEADRQLVVAKIRGRLLDLEEVRMWEKNPDLYSSGITNSAFVIMSRKFAPAADRLRRLIARERSMPAALEAARLNLRNPPRIYTEVALEQLPGIAAFFEKDVPAAFAEVKDGGLLAEFREANAGVLRALAGYRAFLEKDLLAALQRRFSHRRGPLPPQAALRRDGGYPARPPAGRRVRGPAPQPGGLPAHGRANRSAAHRAADAGGDGARSSRARTGCWSPSAPRSADCGSSLRSARLSISPRPCRPSSRKRRPSCAR